jgi:hypothetical protein
MSHREIGYHLRTRWVNGTLAAGWVYRGGDHWATPAGPQADAGTYHRAGGEVPPTGLHRESLPDVVLGRSADHRLPPAPEPVHVF